MSSADRVRAIVPKGLREKLRDMLGISALHHRIDMLEARQHETKEQLWERSRARWRNVSPDAELTWGKQLNADAFIAKVHAYGGFGSDKAVLEIGPGYGRLMRSCKAASVPFKSYTGVDISIENVKGMREKFPADNITMVHGDAESVELKGTYDLLISSLTLKHFFPSFEKGLCNLQKHLTVGAKVIFDVIEGEKQFFEVDGVTYIRYYTKKEVEEILRNASLKLLAFDTVQHSQDHTRLLVVAEKV